MSVAKAKIERRFSVEEYLVFERAATDRHECIDGTVYAMAGESLSHSRICMNLGVECQTKLKGTPCEALSPNMKVRTSTASLFAYPDLTIVCEPTLHDEKKDVLTNPKVIFEVLSPSTEVYDRTTKFQRYRLGNPTLSDYILVSQTAPFVEHFRKQHDGNWLYQSFSQLSDLLKIDSINIALSLEDIYDRVKFEDIEEQTEESAVEGG